MRLPVLRALRWLAPAAVLVAAAGTAGCGGSSSHQAAASTGPFGYDASKPLLYVDRGRVNRNYPIAVDDVSYTSGHDRISAFLVLAPGAKGRRPAVIYLHGAGGDRQELLVPSTWVAARGGVALAITAPSSVIPSPAGRGAAFVRYQGDTQRRDVLAVRRAIDLLSQRKDVDPDRIGFVGWSSGSHTGGILAGVEPRLRAIVLMSGGVAPVSEYLADAPAALRPSIRKYLAPVDPLRYLPKARASSLFLQDGRKDLTVPRPALLTFANAAPPGTRLRWYAAGHGLNSRAYRDQIAWLADRLGLHGPSVPHAATGP
jgi:dienelactone hydrolase